MAGLIAIVPALAGCGSLDNFDMDSLDFFHLNDKKKLPGERKEVFPGGVPGVTQGIPPEYMKGNQQSDATVVPEGATPIPGAAPAAQPAPAAKTAAVEEPKPKPKRKPKPLPAQATTQVTVKPAAQDQGQQPAQPWPGSTPQQSQGNDPWLSSPPPPANTLSR
jgi:hypothetical protein